MLVLVVQDERRFRTKIMCVWFLLCMMMIEAQLV